MRLSTQVLIGLGLGIFVGVFLGERATVLDVVGNAFIRLLQMSVIPYVALSLMAGVGKLDAAMARQLALRGGAWLLVLWGVALGTVALFPIAFPEYQTASFFSTALVETPEKVDLLGLYIPANPLYSMVHNLMPAIVLFSLLVGIALLTLPERAALVAQLSTLADALMRLSQWVVRVAPLGVFALMASAAGTLTVSQLQRLQVFVLTFAVLATFLALWVLPALVAAVTPVRYRQVIETSREALVTAFATASLLVVLPILADESRQLAAGGTDGGDQEGPVTDIVVPVAYNFPSVGKLLVLSFILFAGWFSGSALSVTDLPALLGVGTFTFFGPNVMAIPFMLDWFRLPSDLFPVFMAVDVLTGRFFVLVAAMHILSLAILVSFSLEGRIEISWPRLGRWAAVSVVGACALLLGLRFYYESAIDLESKTYQLFVEMELVGDPVEIVDEPPSRDHMGSSSVLELIRSSGTLAICYTPDALPFAFVNEKADLVGFDVDVAHALAASLDAKLYARRTDRAAIAADLADGRCDMAIGGIGLIPERVEEMTFSAPYLDNTLGFIVPDHDRHDWATWDDIRSRRKVVIAAPQIPYFRKLLQRLVPNAEFVDIGSPRDYLRGQVEGADALGIGAEAGGAWTLVYPGYAVVVPKPDPIRIPLAYAVRRGEWEWAAYLSAWIDLKKGDHSIDQLYEHWILGEAATQGEARWSVVRDVLHWVD